MLYFRSHIKCGWQGVCYKHSMVALYQSRFHFILIFLKVLAVLVCVYLYYRYQSSKSVIPKSRYPDSNTRRARNSVDPWSKRSPLIMISR